MRRYGLFRKTMVGIGLLFAGGTVMQGNCINTIASLPICGGLLTFCTPGDQISALFPLLQVPDFSSDPSCTIPIACGGGGLFPPLPGFPGGDAPEDPEDDQGGGVGGGGGGGG